MSPFWREDKNLRIESTASQEGTFPPCSSFTFLRESTSSLGISVQPPSLHVIQERETTRVDLDLGLSNRLDLLTGHLILSTVDSGFRCWFCQPAAFRVIKHRCYVFCRFLNHLLPPRSITCIRHGQSLASATVNHLHPPRSSH